MFIDKIESLKITLRRQNLKVSRNYSEAVSFSIADNQSPPLLSVYTPLQPNKSSHDQTGSSSNYKNTKSNQSRNFSKPVFPAVCKHLLLVLVNLYVLLTLGKPIRPVNSCKPLRPVDCSKPMYTIGVLRFVRPAKF